MLVCFELSIVVFLKLFRSSNEISFFAKVPATILCKLAFEKWYIKPLGSSNIKFSPLMEEGSKKAKLVHLENDRQVIALIKKLLSR
jgi:hypothetical protein